MKDGSGSAPRSVVAGERERDHAPATDEHVRPAPTPGPPRTASAGPEASLVAAGVYAGGRKVAEPRTVEAAAEWLGRPGHMVWIGLFEPSEALLGRLQRLLGWHELAVEDALKAHQRPKVEQYGDALFVVARTAQMAGDRIAFGETHLFVGRGHVVTVRHGASRSYGAVRRRCEACPEALARGEDYVLYAVLDCIVDAWFPVLDAVRAEVDAMEDRVLEGRVAQKQVERLYRLRRDLLRLRNAAVPLAEVCRRLEHADALPIAASMQPLFRDVSDHVRRAEEEIDALREVLAFAFEASLMVGQAQQTETTRRLAAWAAILAVPTAVAGIYGMNFENMPELAWRYGYFAVLAAIALACAWLFWRFRRNGWI